jgi:hypothetical protein
VRVAAVIGGIVLVTVVLVASGHGALRPPARWTIDGIRNWAARRDPLTIVLALLRLIAIGAALQVTAAATCACAGAALHLPTLVRAGDILALPGTRSVVRHLAGAGLSALSLAGPLVGTAQAASAAPARHQPAHTPSVATLAAADGPAVSGSATMRVVDDPATTATMRVVDAMGPAIDPATSRAIEPMSTPTSTATLRLVAAPEGDATMRRTDDAEGTSTMRFERSVAADARATSTTSAIPSPTPPPRAAVWTVEHGDHLWSIARAHLAESWGRTPSEAEVDAYWRALIAANPTLADPDLLFAGEPIVLPPL